MSQIGSSTNLQNGRTEACQVANNLMNLFVSVDSPQSSNQNQSGNVTDEEVELKQNISRSRNPSSDMMIEEPRSRVPVKSVHERGRVNSNEMLNCVNAGDSMGAKSKHAVSINNDPLIGDKVKHGSPDRRSRLPSGATKSEAMLQKNENDCHLLSQANCTKQDPSAKSIISGLPAPANEKKPNSGNYTIIHRTIVLHILIFTAYTYNLFYIAKNKQTVGSHVLKHMLHWLKHLLTQEVKSS